MSKSQPDSTSDQDPDAADEVDRLRQEIARLKAALQAQDKGLARGHAGAAAVAAEQRRGDERFAACVENLLDCFGLFTAIRDGSGQILDFRIDYLNAAACRNNRLALEAQLGRGLCDVLPGHRTSGLFDAYCRVVESGEPLELEQVDYEDEYGEPATGLRRLKRAFDIHAIKLGDGFAASWRDITDKKRAEEAADAALRQAQRAAAAMRAMPTLTSSGGSANNGDETLEGEDVADVVDRIAGLHEALLRQGRLLSGLIDHIPVLLCIWDPRLEMFRFNRKMRDTLGWTEQDAAEGDFMARAYPDAEYRREVMSFMQSYEPRWRDIRTTSKSGHEVEIAWTNVRLSDDTSVGIGVDLSDRNRARDALTESERRLRLALDAARMGVWEVGEGEAFGRIDAGMCGLFGFEPGTTTVPLERFFDLIHPLDREVMAEQVRRAWADGVDFETEFRATIHGQERWLISRGQVVVDGGGRRRMLGVNYDITKVKRAEQAARESEARLYRIFKQAPAMIAVHEGPEHRYVFSNPAHDEAVGQRPLVGRALAEAMPELAGQGVFERFEAVWQTQQPVETPEFEATLHVGPRGEPVRRYYRQVLQPWFGEDGEISGVMSFAYDVTDRHETAEAIRQSEGRLRTLFSSIDEGYCLCEMLVDDQGRPFDYRFLEANPLFEASTGIRDPVGKTAYESVPGLERHWCETYARAALDGETLRFEQYAEPMGKWFDVYASPAGGHRQFVIVFRDITQRKEAEAALKRSEERARGILESIADALITVSRDWRITFLNRRAAEIVRPLHAHREALIGQDLWQSFPGLHASPFGELYRRVMEGDESGSVEAYFQPLDGWFDVRVYPTAEGLAFYFLDVTDRKRAEVALRQTSEHFQTLADNMSQFAWMADGTGHIFWYNRRWYEYTGTTLEEMAGWGWTKVHHPDHIDRVVRYISHCFEAGITWEDTFPLRGKDGQYRWFLSRAEPVKDETGRVVRWLGTNTDVTGKLQAEAQLAENVQRLRLALMGGEMGMWDLNLGSNRVIWNEKQHELWGVPGAPVEAGMPADVVFLQVHPEDRERVVAECMDAAVGRTSMFRSEFRVLHHDGQVRWLVGLGAPVGGTQDAPERLIGVNYDITDRKLAEEALRRSEERFRNMADTAPAMLWITDCRGHCTYISRGWSEHTGQPHDQALGQGWQQMIHPDDRDEAARRYAEANQAQSQCRLSYRLQTADGSHRWALDIGQPRFDDDGRYEGMIGSVIDIHERVQAEEQMRRAKEEAEQASRAKDKFLAVLSHELRTPLSPVLMAVSSMADAPDLTDETRETMAMIRRNVQVEARLIDDLLDISRVLNGKLRLEARPLRLHDVVRHAVETVAGDAEAKNVVISTVLKARVDHVTGDAGRLQQVLCNLLNNAIKFTPAGGQILVTSKLAGGQIKVTVLDTGVGIKPDVLEKIFDPFEQGDEHVTRTFGGMGLGLAVCRGIVEAHLGGIAASSQGAGKGASFTVTLPLNQLPDATPETLAGGLAAPRNGDGAPLRLLLVEDHADTARVLAGILRQQGYEVSVAHSVAEGLAAAGDDGAFDLLLSDLGLPDGTGYDLMAKLKGRRLRGIAMSGFGMEADIDRSRAAGFSEHLVKPVDLAQLQAAIARVAQAGP